MLPILALLGTTMGKMAGAKLLQSGIGGQLASSAMQSQGGAAAGGSGGGGGGILDGVTQMFSGGGEEAQAMAQGAQQSAQQGTAPAPAGQGALQQIEQTNQSRIAEAQRLADEERRKREQRHA